VFYADVLPRRTMGSATLALALLLFAESLSPTRVAAQVDETSGLRYSPRTFARIRRAARHRLSTLRTQLFSLVRPPPEKDSSDALGLTIDHLSAAFPDTERFARAYQLHFQQELLPLPERIPNG
jgi:hypothetical protein